MKKQLCVLGAAVVLVAVVGCESRMRSARLRPTYREKVVVGKPIEFQCESEDRTDHPCLRDGSYHHVYETDNGLHGREVWLCCIDPDEILRDSFHCSSEVRVLTKIGLGGNSDYWKIRTCYLMHPTETEPTIIPVCIPAPLSTESAEIMIDRPD